MTTTQSRSPSDTTVLQRYVPQFVAEWLRDAPDERYRALESTLVFADISGFTRLTEMLGASAISAGTALTTWA